MKDLLTVTAGTRQDCEESVTYSVTMSAVPVALAIGALNPGEESKLVTFELTLNCQNNQELEV